MDIGGSANTCGISINEGTQIEIADNLFKRRVNLTLNQS